MELLEQVINEDLVTHLFAAYLPQYVGYGMVTMGILIFLSFGIYKAYSFLNIVIFGQDNQN